MEGFSQIIMLAILAPVFGVIGTLPALVAIGRGHRRRYAITLTMALTGWTMIGWAVALGWACTSNTEKGE